MKEDLLPFCGRVLPPPSKRKISKIFFMFRFDPEKVIDDLMKELELDSSTAVQLESSQGLQLYLGPDGEFRYTLLVSF